MTMVFPDPADVLNFKLTITPDEGMSPPSSGPAGTAR
jgi:hypothetical protein